MKIMIRFLSFLTFFTLATVAGAQEEVPEFTVSIGNFVNPKPADFARFQPQGFVYATKRPSGHTDVYMGGYGTEKAAGSVAETLKTQGYDNAFVSKMNTGGGYSVSVIQLTTQRAGDKIDWEELQQAGKLYVLLNGTQVKIVAGIFADVAAAKIQLALIQKAGFKDAFVKNVNNAMLHEVTDFEMGGAAKKPLIPLDFSEQNKPETIPPPAAAASVAAAKPDIPAAYEELAVIQAKDGSQMTPKGAPAAQPPAAPKTETAPVEKEAAAAKKAAVPEEKKEPAPIKKEAAVPAKTEPAPAKTETVAAQKETSNTAEPISIKPAPAQPVTLKPATPASSGRQAKLPDIRPNVKRTSAIELQKVLKSSGVYKGSLDGFYGKGTQTALNQALKTHAQLQKYQLLAEHAGTPGGNAFDDWEAVRLLRTISHDVSGQAANSGNQALLAQLFQSPKALSDAERKEMENWNINLWKGVDGWSSRDPMLSQIATALKISYLHTEVLFEDYFMNQGFHEKEAKGLGLAAMKALVGQQLERFI